MNNDLKITSREQKIIMLKMLEYVDRICRDNNINYSLIGGTLIGAVRHHGYIPWDDDIDIILTKENYKKLKDILDKETSYYQTLKQKCGGDEFNFIKLIDIRTHAKEAKQLKYNNNYGVYIDIFCYYPLAQNIEYRKKQFNRIEWITKLTARVKPDFKNISLDRNVKQIIKNIISIIIGRKRLNKIFEKYVDECESFDSDYVVSNWPIYGFEKEIQLKKNTEEYIDAEFEGLKVMIFKNYDEILRTTFGDYMQLPPEEERVPKHNMKMWWREGYEDEAEKLRLEMQKDEKSQSKKGKKQ